MDRYLTEFQFAPWENQNGKLEQNVFYYLQLWLKTKFRFSASQTLENYWGITVKSYAVWEDALLALGFCISSLLYGPYCSKKIMASTSGRVLLSLLEYKYGARGGDAWHRLILFNANRDSTFFLSFLPFSPLHPFLLPPILPSFFPSIFIQSKLH